MKSCRFLILYALITFFFTLKSSYAHHQKGKKARIIIPPKEPFLASNAFSFLEENSQTFLGKEATHYGKITKSQKKDQGTRVKADTIRMGIELELQTYQYIPPDLEHFIDHIRLFESTNLHKNDNSPYWYLEVDGSRQLEFVSHDFTLPDEDTTLSKCVLEMNFVMQHLLQLAGPNQKQKKEEEELWAFSIKPGEKIDGIGVLFIDCQTG